MGGERYCLAHLVLLKGGLLNLALWGRLVEDNLVSIDHEALHLMGEHAVDLERDRWRSEASAEQQGSFVQSQKYVDDA